MESSAVIERPTTAYQDQKAGTSGLRKKVTVFTQENYLDNFVQSIFDACPVDQRPERPSLVVSGDGRYWNKEAIQKILRLAAGNGVHKVYVGQHGHLSTPAISNLIRQLNKGDHKHCMGGILLTASHNPGGPENDFGIKFNGPNGGPALESLTNDIFEKSKVISRLLCKELNDVDLAAIHEEEQHGMKIEIVDTCESYVTMMKSLFDFEQLKRFVARDDFKMKFDGMHGISGPYAKRILHQELGVPHDQLMRCDVLEDFGGCHPDPNLTYAPELVEEMGIFNKKDDAPQFGAACDGDADRNMILGKNFFVTPSDSVAIIAACHKHIPQFAGGITGAARSMPTSAALDCVLDKRSLGKYETPTGWKFFGNLLDEDLIQICGEESFGTGSNHVREKDGLWAVLCWLQILAAENEGKAELVTIEQIVRRHWAEFGRNYYQRYDYEGLETEHAVQIWKILEEEMAKWTAQEGGFTGENFTYQCPVDKSVSKNQGWIFCYPDGSRFVFRQSGTGSSGATIRVYLEKYSGDQHDLDVKEALKEIVERALVTCQIHEISGRSGPTVIT